MFPVKTTLQFRGFPALLTKRGAVRVKFRKLVQEANRDNIIFWHKKFFPRHFKPSAVRKYGYDERNETYQRRKVKTRSHNNPLMFSGTLKREASATIEARATARGNATGKMKARAANFAGKADKSTTRIGDYPDLRAELTAVSSDEAQELAQRLQDELIKGLQR